MKVLLFLEALFCLQAFVGAAEDGETKQDIDRVSKLLPVFQVVRFPNDACTGGGSKNGTCYTKEECSTRGGTNSGSCAEGFGVCCTFTLGCGSRTTENCTYFESATSPSTGACRAKICKADDNICQIRLDFLKFVITGPATTSTSVAAILNGQVVKTAKGKEVSLTTQCLTDTFTVSGQVGLPYICGTMTGHHVYFDASDSCNSLDFQLGNTANGVSTVATRSWTIKISQYACDYENLAPNGCDQWYFGTGATNYVYSFNYLGGKHLANQRQTICVRRESGNCKICWSADAVTDLNLTLDTDKALGVNDGQICCDYGTKGTGIDNKGAYDCLMIPGALTSKSGVQAGESFCGGMVGLFKTNSATSGKTTTLCSKSFPFRITFNSDAFEMSKAAKDEGTGKGEGFKLRYFQTACS